MSDLRRTGESANGADISVFLKSFLRLLFVFMSVLLSDLLLIKPSGKANLFKNLRPDFALGFLFSESSSKVVKENVEAVKLGLDGLEREDRELRVFLNLVGETGVN